MMLERWLLEADAGMSVGNLLGFAMSFSISLAHVSGSMEVQSIPDGRRPRDIGTTLLEGSSSNHA